MIRQLLRRWLKPLDEDAIGPWHIYWSDEETDSYGAFKVETFRGAVSWIECNRKNFPATRVIIRSSNDYTYEISSDDKNIRFIRLVRGIHGKPKTTERERASG